MSLPEYFGPNGKKKKDHSVPYEKSPLTIFQTEKPEEFYSLLVKISKYDKAIVGIEKRVLDDETRMKLTEMYEEIISILKENDLPYDDIIKI